ncbi:uncharacterized protein L199_006132 [Kwoniella botswanensis]|uniref:uncharacterized protein n=1 Tax=Kwoniella botswanensis TaxID=1268659 RepID=UPI00315CC672
MEGDSWTRFQYDLTRDLVLSSTNDFLSNVQTLHNRLFDNLEIDWPDEERSKEEYDKVERGLKWVIDHGLSTDNDKIDLRRLLSQCEDEWTKLDEMRSKHWTIMDLYERLSKANDLTQQTFSTQLKMMYPNAYPSPRYGESSFQSQYEITLEDMFRAQSAVLSRRHDYRNIIPQLTEEHEMVTSYREWEDMKTEVKRRGLVDRLPEEYMRPIVNHFTTE